MNKQQRYTYYGQVCKDKLQIEKLELTGVDRFDFYNIHVGNLVDVLEQVYEKGFYDGSRYLP